MALSRAKTFGRPKKTPALQASVVSAVHHGLDSNRLSVNISVLVPQTSIRGQTNAGVAKYRS